MKEIIYEKLILIYRILFCTDLLFTSNGDLVSNRPGVAGAALQTPLQLTDSFIIKKYSVKIFFNTS